jgi:hypothetical protein
MKKNTITIDLDRLEGILDAVDGMKVMSWIKKAQVPERCTLTEAVEKFGGLWVRKLSMDLDTPKKVQQFKSQYLDKEETLEDGIYEGIYRGDTILCYIKKNKLYSSRPTLENMGAGVPATDLINPVKIANL